MHVAGVLGISVAVLGNQRNPRRRATQPRIGNDKVTEGSRGGLDQAQHSGGWAEVCLVQAEMTSGYAAAYLYYTSPPVLGLSRNARWPFTMPSATGRLL